MPSTKGVLARQGEAGHSDLYGQFYFCLERLAEMALGPISSQVIGWRLRAPGYGRDERMIQFASLEPRAGIEAKHVRTSKWCSRNWRMWSWAS